MGRVTYVTLLFLFTSTIFAETFNVRAMWVVRDHITSKEKIDSVLEFAKENNYNHLFVQIRGRGDAYYNSEIVPRSHLLTNPDFDPLAYFLKKGRNNNIKIHAWFNVYYLWSSSNSPIQPNHLLHLHPDWLDSRDPEPININQTLENMRKKSDSNGEGFYLAPTHPKVDAYLQNVITELLQNYSLDGIHFDYIRYHDLEYGLNPTGLKIFLNYNNSLSRFKSRQINGNQTFLGYKQSAITGFLSNASTRIKAYQPDCIISAAVKPNLINARNLFGQEWDVWLAGGFIDWAVPMNYTMNLSTFDKNIQIMKKNLPEKYIDRIVMGIATYNQNAKSAGKKIYHSSKNDFSGISIFSYTVFKDEPSYANKLIKYMK